MFLCSKTKCLQYSLPRHIAVIPDGNRRYMRKHSLNGMEHSKRALQNLMEWCLEMDIPELSLFAWSSENWSRPQQEIKTFMNNFNNALEQWIEKNQQDIRFFFVSSSPEKLNVAIRNNIDKLEALTKKNSKLHLYIYVSYGFTEDIKTLGMGNDFQSRSSVPSESSNPDVLIRTSGEKRLSNFCLWHLAYTELIFVDALFPTCNKKTWEKCMEIYSKRQRRNGK